MVGQGTAVPEPTPNRPSSKGSWIRSLPLWAFWAIGVAASLEAASAAYITYATNDYRPILIRGVRACAVAFLAFHFATFLAKGWKERFPGLVGALLLLSVLSEILRRLR